MAVHSINALPAQIKDLSIPIEQIKLPKISNSVRAIFEECSPQLNLAIPNLQLKAIECRDRAVELKNRFFVHAASAIAGGSVAGLAIGTIYRTVIGSLGFVGASLSFTAGAAAAIYFMPNFSYLSDLITYPFDTEIQNFKAFFTEPNCKAIDQAIRAKIQQMNDKEVTKPKYEKALVKLKQLRGYIC